jgi:hypothetical protein
MTVAKRLLCDGLPLEDIDIDIMTCGILALRADVMAALWAVWLILILQIESDESCISNRLIVN